MVVGRPGRRCSFVYYGHLGQNAGSEEELEEMDEEERGRQNGKKRENEERKDEKRRKEEVHKR